MANTFDMINNSLIQQLERLDDIDPGSDEGKAEIARAQAVKDVCATAIDNANATVAAMGAIHRITGAVSATQMPALLGGANA